MFNLDSTYLDLINSSLGKYSPHLLGYPYSKEGKIIDTSNPWPMKEVIKDLNYLEGLEKKNQLFYKEFNNMSSMLLYKNKARSKVAIVVAGGGYSSVCTLPESFPVAIKLHELGFTSITFNYSLGKEARNSIDELSSLVQYLEANQESLNIDMDKYIVIGFSAGGHLVASLGCVYKDSNIAKPGLLGLCYPVISMKDEYAEKGTRRNLLGENPSKDDIYMYSIEEHVDSSYPPSFIWACKDDNVVPSINSYLLAKGLSNLNIPNHLCFYKGNVHGYGLGSGSVVDGWLDKLSSFYNELY